MKDVYPYVFFKSANTIKEDTCPKDISLTDVNNISPNITASWGILKKSWDKTHSVMFGGNFILQLLLPFMTIPCAACCGAAGAVGAFIMWAIATLIYVVIS